MELHVLMDIIETNQIYKISCVLLYDYIFINNNYYIINITTIFTIIIIIISVNQHVIHVMVDKIIIVLHVQILFI